MKRAHILTEREIKRVFAHIAEHAFAERNRAMFQLSIYAGRLCNLSSGNCIERCSRILASPLYICLCVSAPLFIDFDEDGANEPHERVFIREDPHFGCASF